MEDYMKWILILYAANHIPGQGIPNYEYPIKVGQFDTIEACLNASQEFPKLNSQNYKNLESWLNNGLQGVCVQGNYP
jgi:hypothetical protein